MSPRLTLPPRFLRPSFTVCRIVYRYASTTTSPSPTDKIFIALSSGVDSTVSASLLLAKHPPENIYPIYLANWSPGQNPAPRTTRRGPYGKFVPAAPPAASKCIDREFHRVTQICAHLKLHAPHLLKFEKEYWHDVFTPMLLLYARGLTPNPDVACNRVVKFGALVERLEKLSGGERWWLATGHYAHTQDGMLMRSADSVKDQTYFLSTIPARVLRRCIFPLGDAGLTKKEVKAYAKSLQLPGWRSGEHTKESFGLCFVEPSGGFQYFLGEFLPHTPGRIVVGKERRLWPSGEEVVMPPEGTDVGEHGGLWYATVGEKARLELPQGDKAYQGRWYVSKKDVEMNQIEVVKGGENWALFASEMVVGEWVWLEDDAERIAVTAQRGVEVVKEGWELVTQFRHMQRPVRVRDIKVQHGRVRIVFEEPQKAVTCGQSAALWDGKRCLGGGVIEEAVGIRETAGKEESPRVEEIVGARETECSAETFEGWLLKRRGSSHNRSPRQ